jgi:hypothetical protein
MFFVVGRGRSGTTLLKALLDAHPSISVAPEALFIMNVARAYRTGSWNERRVRRFSRDVFLEDRMRRWGVTREELERRWLALPPDATFARRCAEVYEAHADRNGKRAGRLLGDKNPHYGLFAHELAEIFPRARFVHLVRDYRDNVLSYRNVPFDLSNNAALAYRWKHYNSMVMEAARRHPDRFHRISFEELVTAPATTLDRLCRFLGVESAEASLPDARSETSDVPPWHRHLGGPIDAGLAGRWQQELSAREVATIERICQPLGAHLGYAPASSPMHGTPALFGVASGWAVTALEKVLFRFPIALRVLVIRSYRRATGNVIR